MWGSLLGVFKNWKLILGGIGVISVGLFAYHYFDIKGDNTNLENTVQQQERELQNLEEQNKQQLKEYNVLQDSLARYQESLQVQKKQNDQLEQQLNSAGDNDEKLQECLGTSLPDDILDRLRE